MQSAASSSAAAGQGTGQGPGPTSWAVEAIPVGSSMYSIGTGERATHADIYVFGAPHQTHIYGAAGAAAPSGACAPPMCARHNTYMCCAMRVCYILGCALGLSYWPYWYSYALHGPATCSDAAADADDAC